MALLAVIILALTFLGGVVVTLSTQLACSAMKVKTDAVPATTLATNLLHVVHLTDWTVEGLKVESFVVALQAWACTEPPEDGLGERAGRPHGEPRH